MNTQTKTVLLTGAMMMFASTATANEVGNGGDPIRDLFKRARVAAATMVDELKKCSFDPSATDRAKKFILKHQSALADDIRQSEHKWVVDIQNTCAFTPLQRNGHIYLSYNECKDTVHNINDAIKLLIHESVHHFNVTEEDYADEVASAVFYALSVADCPTVKSPFDSKICEGPLLSRPGAIKKFSPASTWDNLGKFPTHTRQRLCHPLTGCAKWVTKKGMMRSGYSYSSTKKEYKKIADEMEVRLRILNGDVKAYLKSVAGETNVDRIPEGLSGNIDGRNHLTFGSLRNGSMFLSYRHKNQIFFTSNFKGSVRKECFWFRAQTRRNIQNDKYYEYETVVTGEH